MHPKKRRKNIQSSDLQLSHNLKLVLELVQSTMRKWARRKVNCVVYIINHLYLIAVLVQEMKSMIVMDIIIIDMTDIQSIKEGP